MRILLWHGYLLGGTGSNVYTRALARAWRMSGHDVVVFSQDPHPELVDLGGAEVVRPEIGSLLPVFVLDRYDGLEPKYLQDFTSVERDHYVQANAAALREHLPADLVFANHVLPGGAVAAAVGSRYAVKAHGSELEYSMRGDADLVAWGRRSLEGAAAVFVGSEHIRRVLEEVVGQVDRVYEVPPGVDTEQFAPRPREAALAGLLDELARDEPNPANRNPRFPDEGNAERLARFFADGRPVVLYFGKLLYNKGIHTLLEALASVEARGLIVGFGDYREELERLAGPDILFTGALEHRHLAHLIPLCDAAVVPSIFPEAFGMVAAEAAAAGCPPLVARHSGLEEIARGIEAEYSTALRELASFAAGDAHELASKLRRLLALPPDVRTGLGAAARRAAVERWSWQRVAARLLEPLLEHA